MSGPAGSPRDALVVLAFWQAARIARLEAQVAQVERLTAANKDLADRVARLEYLLSRNSGNSSSPPSKDGDLGRPAPKEKKRPGGGQKRAPGGQPGRPGFHLPFTDTPDERVDRFPEGTCGCGADLARAADLGVVDRYQQTEIPLVAVTVTQYDQHAVRCGCGKVRTATRPAGAGVGLVGYGPNLTAWCVYLMVVHHLPVARCAALLESLTGAAPSVGFVHGLLRRTGAALAEAHQRIRALICLAAVVVMDETPLRVGPRAPRPGRKKAEKYLLTAVTGLYTQFLLGDRDLATFQASVLSDLAREGRTVVHDRYTVYDHAVFAARDADPEDPDRVAVAGLVHQICNQHLARDLDGAAEVYPDEAWPVQVVEALRGMIHHANRERHAAAALSATHDRDHCRYCQPERPDVALETLLRRFRDGVKVGLARTLGHGSRPGERKARLLLEFLRSREDDVLRYLTDPQIPPTSNDAERALRPSKIQQGISGRLTSEEATQDRYTILGYLVTAAKHGRDMMPTLRDVFTGTPWIPALPAPT